MNDALRQKLASYGVWTYRSAWALEIMAAAIGMTTGIVLGLQAFRASEAADVSDLILASAPFFMVALAELSKIPIATLLFSANWFWKPILGALLLLLAGITFETVFMGLERSATLRQLAYQELVKAKTAGELDLLNIDNELRNTREDKSVLVAQQNIERVSKLAEDERQAITRQITTVDQELEGQVVLSPDAARLRDRIKEAEERRTAQVAEQAAEAKDAFDRFTSQRDSFVTRIGSATATETQKKDWTNELRQLVNPVTAIKLKYQTSIATIDDEIKALRSEFEKLRSKLVGKSTEQRTALEKTRADLLQSIDASNKKWTVEKDTARQALNKAQAREDGRNQRLIELDQQHQSLIKGISEIESKRVPMARRDQVQRIASRFYGKNPEDIGPDQANLVALIWFSSLAGLAALAGPVTAMVALGLQRIGLTSSAEANNSKTSRLLRKILLSWRWRRVRTKPVMVDRPVDKFVDKIIEVPVEKIIKEILYIPILTDDPEAVKKALYSTLPEDVADVVKVSLKRKSNASPA